MITNSISRDFLNVFLKICVLCTDPVYEDLLSENRKMITNEKIDAYNEAAVSILNSSTRNSKSNVKMFSVSKLIAQETITESLDGLHLPESSRETVRILVSIRR